MQAMPLPDATPPREDPDVLVIGGGIVGLFCAYHLRRAGLGVTVLERDSIGDKLSCSYGNTGFVGTHGAQPLAEPGVPAQGLRYLLSPESPFYVKPRLDPELVSWFRHFWRACNERDAKASFTVLLEMKKRSLVMLQELCASSGDLGATFTERGMLVAYKSASSFEKAVASVPDAVAGGVPLRVLRPGELDELEPGVEFDISGALYNEEGAYLRVPRFIQEFARYLEGMGVEIHPYTEVLDFEVTGNAVSRVRTTRGDIRPGEVVIAAGAWSVECARKLDVGLRMQPAKGYSVTVKAGPGAPGRPVALAEGKVAIAPLGDRVRYGGTLELTGIDMRISQRRVDGILRTVRDYLPGLDKADDPEVWCGFRPLTPDSRPLLGRVEHYANLSVACGHGHIGLGLAPAGGKLIAQAITGEQPDMDLTPFRIGRYGGGASRRIRRSADAAAAASR